MRTTRRLAAIVMAAALAGCGRAVTAEGRVTDGLKQPLASVLVELWAGRPLAQARTSALGRFVVTAGSAWGTIEVRASLDGYTPARATLLKPGTYDCEGLMRRSAGEISRSHLACVPRE
jgi:hypothetical protein